MSSFEQLRVDGRTAYRSGRKRDAVLYWRESATKAREEGNWDGWFGGLVWAATAANEAGDLRLALMLILEARSEEPADSPNFDIWIGRVTSFEVTIAMQPVLERLEGLLEGAKKLIYGERCRRADCSYFEGLLEERRGRWENALDCYERGWHLSVPRWGHVQEDYASGALRCLAVLRDEVGMKDWLVALREVSTVFRADKALDVLTFEVALALIKNRPLAEMRLLIREWSDLSPRSDQYDQAENLLDATVRMHLLDPSEGDPLNPAHPARRLLMRRRLSLLDIHENYNRRRLLLDYRIAALRFAAGMDPVDDLYYTIPQEVVAKPDSMALEIRRRYAKSTAALGWAQALGSRLDGMLQCDWRKRELDQRQERIRQMVNLTP